MINIQLLMVASGRLVPAYAAVPWLFSGDFKKGDHGRRPEQYNKTGKKEIKKIGIPTA